MGPGVLQPVLFLFGVGFLAMNVRGAADLVRYQRRKRSALLIWAARKPPAYGFSLALGVVLGLLFAFKLFILRRPPASLFGEAMMFVYFGYTLPLTTRIARGFYRDGVWADSGFMPWGQISAVSWKEEQGVTLVLISHLRSIARHLQIPGELYGQARRLLRDRVKAHDIHIGGAGLDLGSRDEEDAV
jgi:hypothetical protein